MRQHRAVFFCVTGSFLMGLGGCVADSTKSPSDTVATSAVVQAEEGTGQPPTGEVQERAVPGRMAPGPLLAPALGAAPKGAVPPLQPPPVPLGLPGEFIIFTSKGNPLSAVNGGGNVNDGINTAASGVSTYSKFKLWTAGPQAPQYKFIETANGYTVMAPNGGGRADSTAIVADLKGLPYGQYIPWAMFSFGRTFPYTTTIQTSNGNFVTAVGGGGQLTNALHTDAKTAQSWEYFNVFKCGDLGTGFTYALILQHGISSTFSAPDGGGRTQEAIRMSIPDDHLARFTLIRQADGTYALRTPNGINYVTALGGGGQPPSDENFHTDATQVQAWEKFRIVDNGQCRYTIQTVSGGFVGFPSLTAASLATNISKVDGPLGAGGLGPAAFWLLYMFDLYPGMGYTP